MHRAGHTVLLGLASIGLAMGATSDADATTMIRLSTEELTVMSELVVEGRVASIESKFHEEHNYVYTYVTLEIDAMHKGVAPGETIVLEELGGSVDNMHVKVPGSPAFEVGERVIVFAEYKMNTGYHRTVALAQGKFGVVQDDRGAHLVRPSIIEQSYNFDDSGNPDSTLDENGRRDYDVFVTTVRDWSDRLAAPGGAR